MWHVSSRSGGATLRTAIHLSLTYSLITDLIHNSGHFGPPLPFWTPGPRHCRCCRWLVTPLFWWQSECKTRTERWRTDLGGWRRRRWRVSRRPVAVPGRRGRRVWAAAAAPSPSRTLIDSAASCQRSTPRRRRRAAAPPARQQVPAASRLHSTAHSRLPRDLQNSSR